MGNPARRRSLESPTIPPAWRANDSVPTEFVDALGVWHWGATPYVFACEDGDLVARRAAGFTDVELAALDAPQH